MKHQRPFNSFEKGNEVILKNCSEVIIPEADRKRMVDLLHDTHLETESMKRLARGKFFWSGMKKEIERVFNSCKECLEEQL